MEYLRCKPEVEATPDETMDQLEAVGIVGPSVGGKMRDILVDTYRLEEILSGQ